MYISVYTLCMVYLRRPEGAPAQSQPGQSRGRAIQSQPEPARASQRGARGLMNCSCKAVAQHELPAG